MPRALAWRMRLDHAGGLEERLGRDATAMQAGAADLVVVDEGDLQAELGGTEGRRVAAGPGAEHDQVEVIGRADSHGSGSLGEPRSGRPRDGAQRPDGRVGHRGRWYAGRRARRNRVGRHAARRWVARGRTTKWPRAAIRGPSVYDVGRCGRSRLPVTSNARKSEWGLRRDRRGRTVSGVRETPDRPVGYGAMPFPRLRSRSGRAPARSAASFRDRGPVTPSDRRGRASGPVIPDRSQSEET